MQCWSNSRAGAIEPKQLRKDLFSRKNPQMLSKAGLIVVKSDDIRNQDLKADAINKFLSLVGEYEESV